MLSKNFNKQDSYSIMCQYFLHKAMKLFSSHNMPKFNHFYALHLVIHTDCWCTHSQDEWESFCLQKWAVFLNWEQKSLWMTNEAISVNLFKKDLNLGIGASERNLENAPASYCRWFFSYSQFITKIWAKAEEDFKWAI